uniref:Uncharacterized protein n=1 Tax=Rhizophora mucronata TaxID=61149 RepID=A0A2P2N517_RHIMU
MCSLLKFLTR